jgi:hypothetical protein
MNSGHVSAQARNGAAQVPSGILVPTSATALPAAHGTVTAAMRHSAIIFDHRLVVLSVVILISNQIERAVRIVDDLAGAPAWAVRVFATVLPSLASRRSPL